MITHAISDQLAGAHRALIGANPKDFLIERETRELDGEGGREAAESFVGIVRGRLYRARGREINAEIAEPGEQHIDDTYGLVVEPMMQAVDPETGVGQVAGEDPVMVATDLRAGPHVTDSFDSDLGVMKITQVWPHDLGGGDVWGYDAIVERKL